MLRFNDEFEIVERKGAGHPDTICDALAETLSRNLCREYQTRYGHILHHNVDKALLVGGRVDAAFGGGEVLAPIRIFLAGRAIASVGGDALPLAEIAIEGSRAWLKENLHGLEPDRHVQIESLVQQGSEDLRALFGRRGVDDLPLSNDTSFGVGYAPLSDVEHLVLAIEKRIHGRDCNQLHPAWGEDTKIMAVRVSRRLQLTIACAMIGRFLRHYEDYVAEKEALAAWVRELAEAHGFPDCSIVINAADDWPSGIYLTVTGTSAEAGDDGQVGRGNRINGLITPCRPMSLEAAAGKNPVNHVGKIYNVVAKDVAEALVAKLPAVAAAQCLMVSQIGAPVSAPAAVQIKLVTHDDAPIESLKTEIDQLVESRMERIPDLIAGFVGGNIHVY
ncbi:MAG: methionine adenosyltransferase [Pseudomonadota bacterium]